MKLWWIEDEDDIREIVKGFIEDVFPSVPLFSVEHWDKCFAKPGDVVVHDMEGVGNQNKISGVSYYSCSGNIKFTVDLPKPFSFDELEVFLKDILIKVGYSF